MYTCVHVCMSILNTYIYIYMHVYIHNTYTHDKCFHGPPNWNANVYTHHCSSGFLYTFTKNQQFALRKSSSNTCIHHMRPVGYGLRFRVQSLRSRVYCLGSIWGLSRCGPCWATQDFRFCIASAQTPNLSSGMMFPIGPVYSPSFHFKLHLLLPCDSPFLVAMKNLIAPSHE